MIVVFFFLDILVEGSKPFKLNVENLVEYFI